MNTAFYSTFTEDLAGHGYVVFGLVPTGWVATVFPDGRKMPASGKRSDDRGWITETALPLWAGDLRFMLDRIDQLNHDPNSIFFHRLDLGKIGAFGHSFGGATTILAGLHDQRIGAVLDLDGSPFGVLSKAILPRPLMVIKHEFSPMYVRIPPDEAGKAMLARVEEELSSVYPWQSRISRGNRQRQHMTFSDMSVLQPWAEAGRRLGAGDSNDGAKTLGVICDYLRAYFGKSLLGEASPLLDRPPGNYGIASLDSTTARM